MCVVSTKPLRDGRVHAGHQVVVIGPWIVVVDAAGEGRAISGAAARVEVKNHEIVGGEILKHVVERHAVHGKRPAVDFEDERILFRRVEIRRLHNPALDFRVAAGSEVDFLGFRQVHAAQQAGVDAGELRHFSGPAQVVAHHVGRIVRIGLGAYRHQVAGSGIHGQDMDACGDGLNAAAGDGHKLDIAGAVIFGIEVNGRRIGRPTQIQGIAVIVAADLPHFSAGEGDHIKVLHRVRALRFRVAGEGHGLSIGRNRWAAPGAGFGDQLANGAGRDVGHQQLRDFILQIGFGAAHSFEDDGLAVGCPIQGHGAAQFAGARAPLAVA